LIVVAGMLELPPPPEALGDDPPDVGVLAAEPVEPALLLFLLDEQALSAIAAPSPTASAPIARRLIGDAAARFLPRFIWDTAFSR
jgi:hypothetical protein